MPIFAFSHIAAFYALRAKAHASAPRTDGWSTRWYELSFAYRHAKAYSEG